MYLSMEVDLLTVLPNVITVICIVVIAVTGVLGLLTFKSQPSKSTVKTPSSESRPLGKMEELLYTIHSLGNLQVSIAAVVETSVQLEDAVIKKALEQLIKRHPLLRMHINHVHGKPHFTPCEKEINYDTINESEWEEALERCLVDRLDTRKHLWRMLLVNRPVYTTKKVFIFTFHHSIGDGLCKTRMITEFVRRLNDILHSKAHSERPFKLLPSLDAQIGSLLQRNLIDRLLLQALATIPNSSHLLNTSKKMYCSSTLNQENQFTKKFGTEMARDPNVQSKTCLIAVRFSRKKTGKILSACRLRQATVQGMLSAACALVMKDLLDNDYKTEGISHIPIRTTVNIRRYLNGRVPDDYMGSYFVGLFGHDIHIPQCFSPFGQFWECAIQSTNHLKRLLKSKQIVTTFWNLLETLYYSPKTKESSSNNNKDSSHGANNGANRTSEIISLNNYGRCPEKRQQTDAVQLKACFCAVAEHSKGPVFTINAVTVEEQLCLSFVYYTNITTKHIALSFAERVKKELVHNAMS